LAGDASARLPLGLFQVGLSHPQHQSGENCTNCTVPPSPPLQAPLCNGRRTHDCSAAPCYSSGNCNSLEWSPEQCLHCPAIVGPSHCEFIRSSNQPSLTALWAMSPHFSIPTTNRRRGDSPCRRAHYEPLGPAGRSESPPEPRHSPSGMRPSNPTIRPPAEASTTIS
jgi:hypothetical protein